MKYVVKGFSGKQTTKLPYLLALLIIIPVSVILVQTMRGSSPVSAIEHWIIDEQNGINAEILWQKSIPCLKGGFENRNGIIGITDRQLALPCVQPLTGDAILAYDLNKGEKQWQLSVRSIGQITSSDDGYLVIYDDSTVKRIDTEGNELWQYKFPSRTVRTIIPCENLICIPRGNTGIQYIRSSQTGENLREIMLENIVAVYSEILVRNAGTTVEVINSNNLSVNWIVQVPYKLSYWNFLRYEDILVIHYGKQYVAAYEMQTGTLIWEMRGESNSTPLMIDDKLFLYRPNDSLEIFNVADGNMLGNLTLRNMNKSHSDTANVSLSANSSFLSITFHETNEVLLLDLHL